MHILQPALHLDSTVFDMLQIAGGHPFKPPRQDVNAPDLYIPLMALCTYCIVGSIAMIAHAQWTTDSMYTLVSHLPPLCTLPKASVQCFAEPGVNTWCRQSYYKCYKPGCVANCPLHPVHIVTLCYRQAVATNSQGCTCDQYVLSKTVFEICFCLCFCDFVNQAGC